MLVSVKSSSVFEQISEGIRIMSLHEQVSADARCGNLGGAVDASALKVTFSIYKDNYGRYITCLIKSLFMQ